MPSKDTSTDSKKHTSIIIHAWKKLLLIILIWSVYHLLRDTLSDIFGIHNWFTQILHYDLEKSKLPKELMWSDLGGWRKYSTFPIEIFLIIVTPKAIRDQRWTRKDTLILSVVVLTFLFWFSGYYFVVLMP